MKPALYENNPVCFKVFNYMMKIAIDIRSTVKRKTGIGYYTLNLAEHLAALDTANFYYLYSKIGLFNRKKTLLNISGANFKHRVNRLNLPPKLMLRGVDALHTSSFDIIPPKRTKLILVVHDVIHKAYPKAHGENTAKSIDESLKIILDRAAIVIAVSMTTKNDLIKFYKVDTDMIKVIYPGINEDILSDNYEPDNNLRLLQDKHLINLPYILYVGTIEPRKNVDNLVRAYGLMKDKYRIKHGLVIAGMKGWMYDKVFTLVKELNLTKNIIFTDYVSRNDLRALYEHADMFIYPSFYEGVGLPVLEAFAFGLPVITSNVSSTAEVAGGAALLIDPNKPEDIASKANDILSDHKLKAALKEKALKRAADFSWEKAARRTLEVISESLN
ncbi:MAG: glycosyltransferase family 1 protein [Candidatus Omnitrophota bacterium]